MKPIVTVRPEKVKSVWVKPRVVTIMELASILPVPGMVASVFELAIVSAPYEEWGLPLTATFLKYPVAPVKPLGPKAEDILTVEEEALIVMEDTEEDIVTLLPPGAPIVTSIRLLLPS